MSIDLDRDEKLCEAATLAPWNLNAAKNSITQTAHITWDVWTIPRVTGDMDFIVQARTLLPEYIQEVRRLRDWQRRAMEFLEAHSGNIKHLCGNELAPLQQLIEEAK